MSARARYLSELDAALSSAGVRGGLRERIVAEFADHLDCNPDAELGEPGALASEFADELGTSFARTAAFRAFLALALAGLLVGVRLVTLIPLHATDFSTADTAAIVISLMACQLALVAGGLGFARAVRLGGQRAVPRREAAVLARRAGVGLLAGAVTIVSFPVTQMYRDHPGALSIGSQTTTWLWPIASAAVLLSLLAAVPAVVRAARLPPTRPDRPTTYSPT